jgi:homoserine kinase
MGRTVHVHAPSSISNIACGYDVMGFPVSGHGDDITLEEREDDRLVIKEILGATGIPTDPEENVCTVAMMSLMRQLNVNRGFDVTISKNIAVGSGLGSSASSAVGGVMAVNEILGRPLSKMEMIPFAMEGERVATGEYHADNVAPCMLGGFTVIRSYHPLDIFNIPYPDDLMAVVIFPAIEIKTSYARSIMPKEISLKDGISQWGNVAGLVAGLITKDFNLIGRSMKDEVAEPVRKQLIPHFDEAKDLATKAGALGFTISGSGPTMFALTNDPAIAEKIRISVQELYDQKGIKCSSFVSFIDAVGATVV